MAKVMSVAQRTRINKRRERRHGKNVITAGFEEYLHERHDARSDRQLILSGIYPNTMEEMSSAQELRHMVATLGWLTPDESSLMADTMRYIYWMQDMAESWKEFAATRQDDDVVSSVATAEDTHDDGGYDYDDSSDYYYAETVDTH